MTNTLSYTLFKKFLIIYLLLFSSNIFALAPPAKKPPEPILPASIEKQIPKGYKVMTFIGGELNNDKLLDYLVVAHKKDEQYMFDKTRLGSPRPLFIFIQNKDATFSSVKRNDDLVFQIDQGGQCDPFEDGEEGLVIKNRYFTVQNSVACGQHWNVYTTFRYDAKLKNWLFHKETSESWRMNDSNDPNADALISDGLNVKKANPKKSILFENYKRD